MTYDYLMNGLGTLGLSAGSMYNSYDPLMGMYGMGGLTSGMSGALAGSAGIYGGYGMGMMGMYNPTFMAEMAKMQQQIETSQIKHDVNMHDALTQAKVQNLSAEDRAFFQSVAQDGGIRSNIENLADVIRKGDQDEICLKYDEVKRNILTKYNSYFRNNISTMDPEATVRGVIENMYQSIISKQAGEIVDLKTDIKRYGETALGHGFNKGFASGIWGKEDYHKKYTEETLKYIYHINIDNEHGKHKLQVLGNAAGKGARTVGVPLAVGTVVGLLGRIKGPKTGWAAGITAAILTAAGDYLWQHT